MCQIRVSQVNSCQDYFLSASVTPTSRPAAQRRPKQLPVDRAVQDQLSSLRILTAASVNLVHATYVLPAWPKMVMYQLCQSYVSWRKVLLETENWEQGEMTTLSHLTFVSLSLVKWFIKIMSYMRWSGITTWKSLSQLKSIFARSSIWNPTMFSCTVR